MATLAVGLLADTVISNTFANKGLIVRAIGNTTVSIHSLLSNLTKSPDNSIYMADIVVVLLNTDLDFTIDVIYEFIIMENVKEHNIAIKKALDGISQILILLNRELEILKNAIDYHKTKYFSNWRTFSWNGNIQTIVTYSTILKNRYQILFELLKIYKID